ncbi:MAG: hypothetical protein LBP98_10595, partial [Tannerella sp.]|nr:hypothetical protein [Tannerella sp.]
MRKREPLKTPNASLRRKKKLSANEREYPQIKLFAFIRVHSRTFSLFSAERSEALGVFKERQIQRFNHSKGSFFFES